MSSRYDAGRSRPPPRDYRDLDRERGGGGVEGSGSRGGYDDRSYDRRGPPPPPPPPRRRSVSPPGGRYGGRYRDDDRGSRYDRGDDRYGQRAPRDYYRDDYRHNGPPPPPRDSQGRYGAAPPPPRRDDERLHDRYDERASRRRERSPPAREARPAKDGHGVAPPDKVSSRSEAKHFKAKEDAGDDGEADVGDEEAEMMKAMGFGGFGTTKGAKVQGNQSGLAEVRKERTWRQYMQRKGGFNRPLSPTRD